MEEKIDKIKENIEIEEVKISRLKIIRDTWNYKPSIPTLCTLPKVNANDSNALNKLPEKIGVYFLFDEFKTLLYIGKTINIKNRVKTHLSPNTSGRYNPEENGGIVGWNCSLIPFGVVSQIRFLISDKINYSWLEEFYISIYKPYFNRNPKINLTLKEKWEKYNIFRENKIWEKINIEVEKQTKANGRKK